MLTRANWIIRLWEQHDSEGLYRLVGINKIDGATKSDNLALSDTCVGVIVN